MVEPSDHPGEGKRSPFGELLIRLRTEKGLTQAGLANRTTGDRISPRSITNCERRVAQPAEWILPHRPTILSLARALNCTPEQQQQLAEAWDRSNEAKKHAAQPNAPGKFVRAGREHILNQIREHARYARHGNPQMILLGGEAGMGKTSIARFAADWIAANAQPVVVSWGEATSRGPTIEPYLAIRHATDRLLVTPPAHSTYPGRYASRPALSTERVAEILPFLPKLAGVLVSEHTIAQLAADHPSLGPEAFANATTQSGTETLDRWDDQVRLLTSLSQEWPFLIVVEDLHWASDQTISLLTHLHGQMKHLRDVPMAIIGTFRSDEVREGSRLAALIDAMNGSPSGIYLSLADTLTPARGRAFSDGLLQQFTNVANWDELVEWLYARTSGHPFLASAILQQLQESGALVAGGAGKSWVFNRQVAPTDIPASIRRFIEQRLTTLSDQERNVLHVAAVMGEMSLSHVLADVTGLDEDALQEQIEHQLIAHHHLLKPGDPVMSAGRSYTTYRFSHALYQEYVYSQITPTRRRSLHKQVATVMGAMIEEADVSVLGWIASHSILAEDWEGAARAEFKVGQASALRMDWDLSGYWFERAEDLATKACNQRLVWHIRAARLAMLRGHGDYEKALATGEQILARVAYHDWPEIEALTQQLLGEISFDLGRLPAAYAHQIRARNLHLQLGEVHLAASAIAMLSHITYLQGTYDIARDFARESQQMAIEYQNNWVHSEALLAAANCDTDLGNYQEAIIGYQAAIELAEMIGKLSNQFIPMMNIGLCLVELGRADEAVTALTNVITRMAQRTTSRFLASPYQYLGMAHESLGQWADARAAYQRATDFRQTNPPRPTQYDSIAGLLRIAMATDDVESVRSCLQTIVGFIDTSSTDGIEAPLRVLLTVALGYRYLGKDADYAHAIQQAHTELMRRRSLLRDEAAIASYLGKVAVNRDIQRLFAELAEDEKRQIAD